MESISNIICSTAVVCSVATQRTAVMQIIPKGTFEVSSGSGGEGGGGGVTEM